MLLASLLVLVLVQSIRASGIFDDFDGDLSLESVTELGINLALIAKFQPLVYGPYKQVPVPLIKHVLDLNIVNVNAVDKHSKTSLFYALLSNDFKAAKVLVQYGANDYYPSLYSSAMGVSIERLAFLVEHFKDCISASRFRNLLATAAADGRTEVVRFLLSVKEFEAFGVDGALSHASKCTQDNTEVIQMLLERGAVVEMTCLSYAFDFYDCDGNYYNFLCLLNAAGLHAGDLLLSRVPDSSRTLLELIEQRGVSDHVGRAIFKFLEKKK